MRKKNWRQWMAGVLALAMLIAETPIVQASQMHGTITETEISVNAAEYFSETQTAVASTAVNLELGKEYTCNLNNSVDYSITVTRSTDFQVSFNTATGNNCCVVDDGAVTVTRSDNYANMMFTLKKGTHIISIKGDDKFAVSQRTVLQQGENSVSVGANETGYYRFVALEDTEYSFFTKSPTGEHRDTYGYCVYDGKYYYDDDSGQANNFKISLSMQAGDVCYVGARAYNNDAMDTLLCVEKRALAAINYSDSPLVCIEGQAFPFAGTRQVTLEYNDGSVEYYFWGDENWKKLNPTEKYFNQNGEEITDFSKLVAEDTAYIEVTIKGVTGTIPIKMQALEKISIGETESIYGYEDRYCTVTVSASGWYVFKSDDGYVRGSRLDKPSSSVDAVYLEKGRNALVIVCGSYGENHFVLEKMPVAKMGDNTLPTSNYIYSFTPEKSAKYYFEMQGGQNVGINILDEQGIYYLAFDSTEKVGCQLKGGKIYFFAFNNLYNEAPDSVELTVTRDPAVERLEADENSVRTEFFLPVNRTTPSSAVNGMYFDGYYEDGTVERKQFYVYNSDVITVVFKDASGNVITGVYDTLPLGKYTAEFTWGEGTYQHSFEIKNIDNELQNGERWDIPRDSKTHYAKLVVGPDEQAFLSGAWYSYSIMSEDGSYPPNYSHLGPGVYYISANNYWVDTGSYLMAQKYTAPASVTISVDGPINALFNMNSLNSYANEDMLNISIVTKSGEKIEANSFYTDYFRAYPITHYITDEKGTTYSTYSYLNPGKYTLHFEFDDTEIKATANFEVKIPTDLPAIQIGKKYSVPSNYKYEYYTFTATKDMDIFYTGETYASVQIYDPKLGQYSYYSMNQKMHLTAGKYYLSIGSYAGTEIHFEILNPIKSVKEVSGKTAEITYGTWGQTTRINTVSGNTNSYTSVSSYRVPPYAVLNELYMGNSASGSYLPFNSFDVSGNNPYASGVSGNNAQDYCFYQRPKVQYDNWILEAIEETGTKLEIKFNEFLWNAYGFATRLFFNEDGTPAKSDRNGYLAPGTYDVQISDGDKSTTVKMNVVLPKGSIYMKEQPENAAVFDGDKASFKVNVLGDVVSYQWQYSKDGKTWADSTATSAKTATLSFSTKESYDGRMYRCIVKSAKGSVISNPATLTVKSLKPVIFTQPVDVEVAAGETVKISVIAQMAETYQWQYSKDGKTWTDSTTSSAKKATLSFSAKESYDGRMYRCIVKNAKGSVTSASATLTIKALKPAITTQPVDVEVTAGTTVKFSVVAKNADTYQWQYSKDGKTWIDSTVSSAQKATLSFSAKESYDGRMYRCIVKNAADSVTSASATLTIKFLNPVISTQPVDVEVTAGETVKFSVVAKSADTYQWQYSKDGKTWTDSTASSAKTATLSVSAKDSYNGRMYRCIVKNATGSTTSTSATLTIKSSKLAITTQPVDVEVTAGETVKFSVVAQNATSYQWQYSKDGINWTDSTASSAKTATFSCSAKESYNGRMYRCIVKNATDSATSASATLTIKSLQLAISTQPVDVEVTAGATVKFSVVAQNADSYQWQYSKDGINWTDSTASSAKTATFSCSTKESYNGRMYRCIVKNATDSVTSTSATLTVKAAK